MLSINEFIGVSEFRWIRANFNLYRFTVYSCHGSWTENATVYMVAKHAGSQHGVCITYLPLDGGNVQIVIGDSCYRAHRPVPDHHLTTNVTIIGKWPRINNGHFGIRNHYYVAHAFLIVNFLYVFYSCRQMYGFWLIELAHQQLDSHMHSDVELHDLCTCLQQVTLRGIRNESVPKTRWTKEKKNVNWR